MDHDVYLLCYIRFGFVVVLSIPELDSGTVPRYTVKKHFLKDKKKSP